MHLGRARSDQSLVRPERVAGSDGLSKTPETDNHGHKSALEWERPFIYSAHSTSSPGGGLNTHTVTEYIITGEDITKYVTKSTDKLNRPENETRLMSS